MNTRFEAAPIRELLESISVPESAYAKAKARYDDLGKWFERPESECSNHSPHIYPQGSFRLGTVIRPVGKNGEYDLDLGCRLREGISKGVHSQKFLKELVGRDLEAYRKARSILSPLEPKHRCWRLAYADELSFHMDIVPSIPEGQTQRLMLKTAMVTKGFIETLAMKVADHAGSITDDRHASYSMVAANWRISNSEGYAIWFESRMRLAQTLLEKRAAARLDSLPARNWNSPLQQVVQLLKWHRDNMFQKNPDSKPISVILTTLAAHSYSGEGDVEVALANVLNQMGGHVRQSQPKVPNPINPLEEDFADKWHDTANDHLALESNFWKWLEKAKEDFGVVATTSDPALLEKVAAEAFGTRLPNRRAELERVGPKRIALFEKAGQIASGARTGKAGVIGAIGVSNLPHSFYGDESLHSTDEA